MPALPDQPAQGEAQTEEGLKGPAFQRPVFVSEEVWNRKFASDEADWATPGEVAQAMEKLAEAGGGALSRPWVAIGLIAINILLFAGAVAAGVSPLEPDVPVLARWGANVGPLVIGGQWWRLFTCIFLHIGVIHLASNMAVLWSIGDFVERLLGRVGFGVVYLLAGLGASLTSISWNPDVVSAGASGAIFGLYGALLGFLVMEPNCVPLGVRRRLLLSALFFVGFNMLHAVTAQGIDIGAHLGGLGAGWICGLVLARPISKEGIARRHRVNGFVLVLGLLLMGGFAALLPKISGDTGKLVLAGKAETRALAIFEASSEKVRNGTFTNVQFADAIEREVVPRFRDCRTRLEALLEVPRFSTEKLMAMVKVTKAQEDAYCHMAYALRTGNQNEAAKALKERADALAQFQAEMKALNP